MQTHTLSGVCQIIADQGVQARFDGDGGLPISGVATLEDAVAGQISFLSNPKYAKFLAATRASAVIVKPEVEAPNGLSLIRADDPYAAITVVLIKLHGYREHRPPPLNGHQPNIDASAKVGEGAMIHAGATIAEDVVIGRDATIYPGSYIGPRCHIGDGLLLYPNVVLYDDTVIGDRVTIHAGTSVGNDGLGYAPLNGKWIKIPQIGYVEIGDDVELGSNCSIDRATLGKTVIGSGTKFSNLIAVGHGTKIGEHCMLVAQAGLAGSVTVGKHVTIAGQAGIVGHVRIGDEAVIAAKAGVTHSVPDGETVLGMPAMPLRDKKRELALLTRLPRMKDTLKTLEKKLDRLDERLNNGDTTSSE